VTTSWIILALAGFCAGAVNVVAGGGAFITFPALILTGLDPRAANITSTLGLYPAQVTSGYAGRQHASNLPQLSFRAMLAISFIGGGIGAGLLLLTSSTTFNRLVPWLVLFATAMFAWGSFRKPPAAGTGHHLGRIGFAIAQLMVSVYVGYYGGGSGFMMLAALTLTGMPLRAANASKIILISVMNTSAVVIFLFSHQIAWMQVLVLFVSSEIGSHTAGTHMLNKVNERVMRIGIIALGLMLAAWLFVRI
jgi:uncharacterized membrane protein YfcA